MRQNHIIEKNMCMQQWNVLNHVMISMDILPKYSHKWTEESQSVSRTRLSLTRGFPASRSTWRPGEGRWARTQSFCLTMPCLTFQTPESTPPSKISSRFSANYRTLACRSLPARYYVWNIITQFHFLNNYIFLYVCVFRIPGCRSWRISLSSFYLWHLNLPTSQGCWIYMYPLLWHTHMLVLRNY